MRSSGAVPGDAHGWEDGGTNVLSCQALLTLRVQLFPQQIVGLGLFPSLDFVNC